MLKKKRKRKAGYEQVKTIGIILSGEIWYCKDSDLMVIVLYYGDQFKLCW